MTRWAASKNCVGWDASPLHSFTATLRARYTPHPNSGDWPAGATTKRYFTPWISKTTKNKIMKRKTFVSILIVLLTLLGLTRCKLAEVENIDVIPCPDVVIDTVIIPGWDDQPDN